MTTATDAEPEQTERNETYRERLDRNTQELINELRVAVTGSQVLLGFLLIAPFDQRFKSLTPFERGDYFATLLCVATAVALLIAPTVHHRVMFRQGEKAYFVRFATRLAIVASGFIAAGLIGILVLITHMVFGSGPAIAAGVVAAILLSALWFVVPMRRLSR